MRIEKEIRSKIFIPGFLLFLLFMSVIDVYAFDEGLPDRKLKRDKVISKMNLTPEQKQEIIETQEIQKYQLGKIRRALCDKRSELADELKQEKLNFDNIKDITNDIKDLQGQLIDNRISHFIRLKKILTKEQMDDLLDSYKVRS
jgi:Spy/CpxP family protein refolding chaperone